MTDPQTVRASLEHFTLNIDLWQAEAARLRNEASALQPVETERLVEVETTAGEMYLEIESFNKAVADLAAQSPAAAGELAEVGEALHLLLLEITELGTRLYSTRSGQVVPEARSEASPVAEPAGT